MRFSMDSSGLPFETFRALSIQYLQYLDYETYPRTTKGVKTEPSPPSYVSASVRLSYGFNNSHIHPSEIKAYGLSSWKGRGGGKVCLIK
jgi:hypothetical protein